MSNPRIPPRPQDPVSDAAAGDCDASEDSKVRIVGHSMWPALRDGQVVAFEARPALEGLEGRWPPRIGDIVVARHPFRRNHLIVKRVAAIADGRYDLRGDDPLESEDSSHFGLLPESALVGCVPESAPTI